MPYIKPETRDVMLVCRPSRPGDLAFKLAAHINQYLQGNGRSFQTFCEVEGVLQCLSKEIYRRLTAPYEDEKIKQNGDVFDV